MCGAKVDPSLKNGVIANCVKWIEENGGNDDHDWNDISSPMYQFNTSYLLPVEIRVQLLTVNGTVENCMDVVF